MLSTLFKYEFKNTAKVMLTVYGVLALITVLGVVLISGYADSQDLAHTIESIFLLVYLFMYMMTILAYFLITIIYLTVHFYKTMYASQGYLTFTLPVKPVSIFNVKLLVSAVWVFLSVVFILLSLFSILSAIPGFMDEFYYKSLAGNSLALYLSSIGMRRGEFIVYLIISYIILCFIAPLRLYVSCSIGQLFNQRKVTASIIIGIILFFAHNSISSSFVNLMELYREKANLLYSGTVWILLGFDLFFVILFYLGNVLIVKKHINLE